MDFTASTAELFLASEIEWDSEPPLSQAQQIFLLQAAVADDGSYSLDDNMGAAIYLGLTWRLRKAIEYSMDDEYRIFDHLKEMLGRWAKYADPTLGTDSSSLELVELEVGQNFG